MASKMVERRINTRNHKNYKVLVESYNSARDVAEDCKKRELTNSMFHDWNREPLNSWHGVKTYEEALNLLANGYQPTVDKMKDSVKFTVASDVKRIQFKNDIIGFAPIVPHAMMGIPQSMINMRMKPIKAKVIDVYYDMVCNCDTKPHEILKAGQEMLSAIIELEHQGYKFNLYGVQSYTDGRDADILTVKIKSSSQPLDLKRISFPLTHTGFFRVIGFDWYGRCPKAKFRDGYGRAACYEFSGDELSEFSKELFGRNSVFISAGRILRTNFDKEYFKEVFTDGGKNTNKD